MSLPELLEDVAAALEPVKDEMEGLSIYPHWTDVPTPPAIDVYPGNPFQTGAGFAPGRNRVFLTVRARAGMSDPASGQTTLLRLLDPDDPACVEKALADADLAVTEGGVSGFIQYADDAPANERLLGCEWRITTFL